MNCKIRAGFTLTEILVALAVVSALLAILFPALSSARKATENSVCVENLRKLGVGMNLYANDNNGLIPAGYLPPSMGGGTLEDLLTPYVAPWISKERGIAADEFYCPTNVRLKSPPKNGYLVNAKGEGYYKGWSGYYLGYRINTSIHPVEGDDSTNPYQIQKAKVILPSKVVSLLETNTREHGGGPPTSSYKGATYFDPKNAQFAGFGRVHGNFGNILFVDGHVERFDDSRGLPVASLPTQEKTWFP